MSHLVINLCLQHAQAGKHELPGSDVPCVLCALAASEAKLAEAMGALTDLVNHESPSDWPWSQALWERAARIVAAAREGEPGERK